MKTIRKSAAFALLFSAIMIGSFNLATYLVGLRIGNEDTRTQRTVDAKLAHQSETKSAENQATRPEGNVCNAFLSEKDPFRKTGLFHTLIDSITAENAPALLDELVTDTSPQIQYIYHLVAFFRQWAIIDWKAALSHLEHPVMTNNDRLREVDRNHSIRRRVIIGWAYQDPDGALEWLENKPVKGSAAVNGVLEGLVARDPDNTIPTTRAFLDRFTDPEVRERTSLWSIAEGFTRKEGIDSTLAYADALQNYELGPRSAREVILSSLLNLDASVELSRYLLHPEVQEEVNPTLYSDTAYGLSNKTTPQEALAWAESLTGNLRHEAIKGVYKQWSEEDPLSAGEAISELPPSKLRDDSLAGLAFALQGEMPETSIDLAYAIDDLDTRHQSMAHAYRRWRFEDKEAALAWHSELSPELQENIAAAQKYLDENSKMRIYHDGEGRMMMRRKRD